MAGAGAATPAVRGGDFKGFVPPPPVRVAGLLRVPLATRPRRSVPPVADRPLTPGGRRRTSWTHCLLLDGAQCGALPVALPRPAWEWWGCVSARCEAAWNGAGDRRQMMYVGPVCCCGLHGLCPPPRGRRLAVLRGVSCSCRAGIGQGSLLPGASLAPRPSSPGHEGCLGPTAVRMVGGGFHVCRRGNPNRVVAPGGVTGSHGVPFALGAPGPLGTVVPGSPGIKRCPRCCAFAWLRGCGGPRVGATISVARSFHPGYRSRVATYCPWVGWSMVVGGACGAARWPKATSAMVRVPSSRWLECEVSSHQMLVPRASRSPLVTLVINSSRSWAAACSAWVFGRRASPSERP